MAKKTTLDELDRDDDHSIKDLSAYVAEITKFWQMGDNKIIPETKRALLRVLHAYAKRLQRAVPVHPPEHFKKS